MFNSYDIARYKNKKGYLKMKDKLSFINDIDASVLSANSGEISKAIIGDENTKAEFVKKGYEDLDYLEYFLDGAVSALGEVRREESLDLKIKDLRTAVDLINNQTKEDKVRLAMELISWFEHVSAQGLFNVLSNFFK